MDGVPIRVAERLAADVRMLSKKVLEILVTLTNDALAVGDSFLHSEVDVFGLVVHGISCITLPTALSNILFIYPEVVSLHEHL